MAKEKIPKPLEQFVEERAEAKFEEHEAILRKYGAQIRGLKVELSSEREKVSTAQADLAAAEKALSLYQQKYDDRPRWLLPPKGKGKGEDRGTLLALLSDTHYGEVVNPAEVGGYNKFDLAIAEIRTERFFRRTVRLARNYFAGVKYDGIVLALGGDLVSGDIHDELQQTNAASTYDTVRWALPRLATGVEMLAKEFGQVHVISVPGNHGRDAKAPRYKRRSAHNADTHLAHLIAMLLAKSGDVTFHIPEALDATFKVYDFTFSAEHGDELARSFAGSAEIGPLGPLMRGTNRKKVALAAEGTQLDYALWFHFHKYLPLATAGFIGNGSLKGSDEYTRGAFKFRPEPPQQALMVVDPMHGVTLQAPVFVADREAEAW